MGIQIGEIDIASQIIDNEFQIHKLYGIINHILAKTNVILTDEEIKKIEKDSVEFLQKKYPNSGIELKKREEENASEK